MGNNRSKEVVIEIGPVGDLSLTVDAKNSTALLTWTPPSYSTVDITGYKVDYGTLGQTKTIDGASNTMLTFNVGTDLPPFTRSTVQVKAVSGVHSGTWSSTTEYIACECIVQGCHGNKVIKIDGKLFPYCGRQHAREEALKYCMLPDCGTVKTDAEDLLGMYKFFCGRQHINDAAQREFLGLVEVDRRELDFSLLCRKFTNGWRENNYRRLPCPTVHFIVAVVNPYFSKRFQDYIATLPPSYREIEQYFHATSLTCKMGENAYIDLCENTDCGACGISRKNFQASRVRTGRWQRYGHGFYLAPDSSKSNDYASTNGRYKAMFVCDVAPGNKYNFLFSHSEIKEPPQGFHSVYGKFGDGLGDLNFDEIVVYTPDAICPRYILLYS